MDEYMTREEKQKFQMELIAATKLVAAQNQSANVYHERWITYIAKVCIYSQCLNF